jgi:hypothetical protein
MNKFLILPILLATTLAGCHTSPNAENRHYDSRTNTISSSVELSEKDILRHSLFGSKGAGTIRPALKDTSKYVYHQGSRMLVLQSGQESPDEALLAAFRKTYMPVPISGVRITLEACLRIEPEDLNYDYNDLGTGSAPNSARWPVMRDRGTSGNTGGKLYDAIRNVAIDSGADTIVVVWTSTLDPKETAFRAAVINAYTGYWEVVSPDAGIKGGPSVTAPERKPALYEALAKIVEVKKDGVSIDRSPRD